MADLAPASSSPPQQPLAHGNIKHGAFEKDLCHKPSKNLAYISGVARVLLEKNKDGDVRSSHPRSVLYYDKM